MARGELARGEPGLLERRTNDAKRFDPCAFHFRGHDVDCDCRERDRSVRTRAECDRIGAVRAFRSSERVGFGTNRKAVGDVGLGMSPARAL
jgi:hypothetical protein